MEFLIYMVIAVALSYGISLLTRQKIKGQDAKSEQPDVPVAEEGKNIPVLFGTKRICNQNVVWYGDLKTTEIKK